MNKTEFLEQAAFFQKSVDWCIAELAAVQVEIEYLDANPGVPNMRERLKEQMAKLVYLEPKLAFEEREMELLEVERLKLEKD